MGKSHEERPMVAKLAQGERATERNKIMALGFQGTRETLDRAAEVFWKVAGDPDQKVSRSDADAYEYANLLVKSLYLAAFADADEASWADVREKLDELGPYDAPGDSPAGAHGIASYHAAVMAERAAQELEDAKEAFRRSFEDLVREAEGEHREAGPPRPSWAEFRHDLEDITRDVLWRN